MTYVYGYLGSQLLMLGLASSGTIDDWTHAGFSQCFTSKVVHPVPMFSELRRK